MSEKIWIFATGNKGKVKEMEALLSPAGIKLRSLKDIGFSGDIEETGNTFEKNAFIKAKTIAELYDYPVIADDSGLQVDALDGAPGVFSARYAGPGATDEDNRNKLLKALESASDRSARGGDGGAVFQRERHGPLGRQRRHGELLALDHAGLGAGRDRHLALADGENSGHDHLGRERRARERNNKESQRRECSLEHSHPPQRRTSRRR